MNISGLTPIRLIEKPGGNEVQLRTNQRISAEILSVNGDQVDMVIRGIRVVGKLVSKEQSAELAGRQSAQFIVKGMVDGQLQIKLLGDLQSTPLSNQENQWLTLSKNLLHLIDVPADDENLILAKALLKNNLPVTRNLIEQLKQALQSIDKWGEAEADMAAALKAGGFPISNGSLELALQKLPDFNSNILELITEIQKQIKQETSPEMRQILQAGLDFLDGLRIDLSSSADKMAEQIKNVIALFGKSVESNIASLLDENNGVLLLKTDDGNLNLLYNLRSFFSNKNNSAAVKLFDSLIGSMRQMQLLNTAQITDPLDPPWLTVNLPINAGALLQSQQKNPHEFSPANIKVSYQAGKKDKKIDPQDTRLILTFELDNSTQIKIDISMLGKKMGAWMTVNSEKWKNLVEEESPTFKDAMEKLGYELQFTKCSVTQNVSMLDTDGDVIPTVALERINIKA